MSDLFRIRFVVVKGREGKCSVEEGWGNGCGYSKGQFSVGVMGLIGKRGGKSIVCLL